MKDAFWQRLTNAIFTCQNRKEKKNKFSELKTFTQKDRSGITHLCNVSVYPTDPLKKWDVPNIRYDR